MSEPDLDSSSPIGCAISSVLGTFTYIVDDGRRHIAKNNVLGRIDYENVIPDRRELMVSNARLKKEGFLLERNGFQLVKHISTVSDFLDQKTLNMIYRKEIERLILDLTGASRVHLFDHTLRSSDNNSSGPIWMRETVNYVHNDYTNRSAPKRVQDILPEDAKELLQHRFSIIQVWRTLRSPVEKLPLAMCDAQSLSREDFLIMERTRKEGPGGNNRVGELYHFAFNEKHKWFYFPKMIQDEVLVFKTFDSDLKSSSRFTAHAAFEDPTSPKNAAERLSIDSRAFAFFAPKKVSRR